MSANASLCTQTHKTTTVTHDVRWGLISEQNLTEQLLCDSLNVVLEHKTLSDILEKAPYLVMLWLVDYHERQQSLLFEPVRGFQELMQKPELLCLN